MSDAESTTNPGEAMIGSADAIRLRRHVPDAADDHEIYRQITGAWRVRD